MGPSGQDELLQRLLDDDLSAQARAEVEQRLSEDPEAAAEFRSLQRLSELMAVSREEQVGRLDSDALFARITAELDAPPAAEPAVASPVERRESWLQRLIRGGVVMPIGGAVALAAAALLTFYAPSGEDVQDQGEVAIRAVPESQPGSDGLIEGEPVAALSSEIVQVDFGGSTGTVFEIALKDGASTPVVWINDEE